MSSKCVDLLWSWVSYFRDYRDYWEWGNWPDINPDYDYYFLKCIDDDFYYNQLQVLTYWKDHCSPEIQDPQVYFDEDNLPAVADLIYKDIDAEQLEEDLLSAVFDRK